MTKARTLIHYHIFKNAGTSIDTCLRRSLGERWGSFEGTHAHDIQAPEQLARFMEANPHLRAISSHLARPPLPAPHSLPVVFIRHPLLRAYSVYHFTRKDTAQPFSDVAQSNGFADYIRWTLREEPGSIVIRDYQVVHLSAASWRCKHILDARATEQDLRQACSLLDSWGMAGVVEQFERSVDAYQASYGPLVPGLQLAYDRENVTEPTCAPVDDRLEQLRQMLGQDLYARFMAANALDLGLHEHATRLLEQALSPASSKIRAQAL
nr:sulfotransferase family 2 domain-containing protein [Dyella sp. ASV24]